MPQSSQNIILYQLKSRGPQTTSAIARRLNISSVGARKHLLRLADQGLVEFEDRREDVGRPKRYWSLTPHGHARFPDAHSDLTLDLLRSVRKVFGDGGLDRLIQDREQDTLANYEAVMRECTDLLGRVKKLTQLRRQEGYMAEWKRHSDGSFSLIENHCPICAAASECQGLCRSELAIFQKALGEDVTVARTDHILAGARRCAYRIAPANDGR